MGEHLARACEMGRLCSNDPVCADHSPAEGKNLPTERYVERAVCHGCLYTMLALTYASTDDLRQLAGAIMSGQLQTPLACATLGISRRC